MDWVARRIALDYLPADTRSELDILSVDEQAHHLTDQHPTAPGNPV